jgi:hypothetical protein
MSATPEHAMPSDGPQITRLALSRAAKRIVILFIVLGVLVSFVSSAVSTITTVKASRTAEKLDDYHAEVSLAFTTFATDTQACGGQLACLHEADGRMAAALELFGQQLDTLEFPAPAVEDARQLRADVTGMVSSLHELQAAQPAAYNNLLPQLRVLAGRFDSDYATLRQTLPG